MGVDLSFHVESPSADCLDGREVLALEAVSQLDVYQLLPLVFSVHLRLSVLHEFLQPLFLLSPLDQGLSHPLRG